MLKKQQNINIIIKSLDLLFKQAAIKNIEEQLKNEGYNNLENAEMFKERAKICNIIHEVLTSYKGLKNESKKN